MKYVKSLFKLVFFSAAVVVGLRIYRDKNVPELPEIKTDKKPLPKPSKNSLNKKGKVQKGLSNLNDRQRDILQEINNKGELDMGYLKEEFSSVTPRTLRRDLNKLEKLNLIKQIGKTKSARYLPV